MLLLTLAASLIPLLTLAALLIPLPTLAALPMPLLTLAALLIPQHPLRGQPFFWLEGFQSQEQSAHSSR